MDSGNYQRMGEVFPPLLAVVGFLAVLLLVDDSFVHRLTLGLAAVAVVFTIATLFELIRWNR